MNCLFSLQHYLIRKENYYFSNLMNFTFFKLKIIRFSNAGKEEKSTQKYAWRYYNVICRGVTILSWLGVRVAKSESALSFSNDLFLLLSSVNSDQTVFDSHDVKKKKFVI